MFSENDLNSFAQRGISVDQVEQQIRYFKHGFPHLNLVRAAAIGDGIIKLTESEVLEYVQYYQQHLGNQVVVKFVPASGAASRMFKDFFALMNQPEATNEYSKAVDALENLTKFAFYQKLKEVMASSGQNLDSAVAQSDYGQILKAILTAEGLNYGALPKGLLDFHKYGSKSRVPAEEHMVEAANYGTNSAQQADLHFTVSPQHRSLFDDLERRIKPRLEAQYGVTFNISYSEQKPSTDTIATDPFYFDREDMAHFWKT